MRIHTSECARASTNKASYMTIPLMMEPTTQSTIHQTMFLIPRLSRHVNMHIIYVKQQYITNWTRNPMRIHTAGWKLKLLPMPSVTPVPPIHCRMMQLHADYISSHTPSKTELSHIICIQHVHLSIRVVTLRRKHRLTMCIRSHRNSPHAKTQTLYIQG